MSNYNLGIPAIIFQIILLVLQTCVNGQRKCNSLNFDGQIICISTDGRPNNCKEPQDLGTIAIYKCDPHYVFYEKSSGMTADTSQEKMECRSNGKWIGYTKFKSFGCREVCGEAGFISKPLIVNGVAAMAKNWPWHAILFRKLEEGYGYICGGTIIGTSAILTAAHCVTSSSGEKLDATSTIVVLGPFSSTFAENVGQKETKIFNVTKIFVPETYDASTQFQSDVAVLQLGGKILYNENISPICLPNDFTTDAIAVEHGNLADVVGFGVDETTHISKTLKHGVLEIKSRAECLLSLGQITTESQFCAGGPRDNPTVTVCNGDSGGGLFHASSIHKKYYIHGIVSHGGRDIRPRLCKTFAVFTRVYSFTNWIKGILEEIRHTEGANEWERRCRYVGLNLAINRDIKKVENVISASDCCNICLATPGCKGFTQTGARECWLKEVDEPFVADTAGHFITSGVIEVFVDPEPPPSTEKTCKSFALNQDLDPGHDLLMRSQIKTFHECCTICKENRDCKAFVHNNRDECYLKYQTSPLITDHTGRESLSGVIQITPIAVL